MTESEIANLQFAGNTETALGIRVVTLEELFERFDGSFEKDPAEKTTSFDITKPHRLDAFALHYIHTGSGTHDIDFERYPCKDRTLLLVGRGRVQSFVPQRSTAGYVAVFTEDFLLSNLGQSDKRLVSQLYNHHQYQPDVVVPADSKFRELFAELHEEYVSNVAAKSEMLTLLLKRILLEISRLRNSETDDEASGEFPDIFVEFWNLIQSFDRPSRNAKSYAVELGVSYKHLNESVKNATGSTAKRFIDDFVVLEAKRQLAATRLPISEIARVAGFERAADFTKYFSRLANESPRQFRSRLRG